MLNNPLTSPQEPPPQLTPLWDQTYEKAKFERDYQLNQDNTSWLKQQLRDSQKRLHNAYNTARHHSLHARHSQTLRVALDSTNAKLQQLHQELFITKQARSDEKTLLIELKNKCEKLESENSALGTELEEKIQAELQWDEGIRDCERYVAILTSRLDEAVKAKDENRKWSLTLASQLDSAHHRLESALRELQELKVNQQHCKEEKEIAEAEVISFSEKIIGLQSQMATQTKKMDNEVDMLKKKLYGTQMDLTTTQANLLNEQKMRQRVEQQLKDTVIDLQGTRQDWASSRSMERALQNRLNVAEESSKEYATQITTLLNDCEQLKSKELDSSTLKERYSNELQDIKQSNEKLRRENDLLEVKCERLSLELQATKSALIELQRKIDEERGARQTLVSQLIQGDSSNDSQRSNNMNGLSPKGGNTVSGLLDSVSEYAGHRLSRHLSSGSNNGLY